MADEAIRKAADDLIEAFDAFVDLVLERLPVKESEEPPLRRFRVRVHQLPVEWESDIVLASSRREAFTLAMCYFPANPRLDGRYCLVGIHSDDDGEFAWDAEIQEGKPVIANWGNRQ